jgi:predicted  nucleic acid-binding Zn-ribbon protein
MSLYNELAAKQKELSGLQDQLSDLQDKLKDIENNPEQYADLESQYDDFLDEIYAEVCEALPVYVTGSKLIAEHDPTMYRCGFSDYCSDYDYSSLDVYTDMESEIEYIEDQISDLESEISEIESEIEGLEDEENA